MPWVLLIIALATLAFGTLTAIRYREFATYRRQTIDDPAHPPPWKRQREESPVDATGNSSAPPVSVEACLDWTLRWGTQCKGLPTLCEVHSRRLMGECLASAERHKYCQSIAAAAGTTGFGYAQCEARRAQLTDTQLSKAEKKYCAAMYRVIAAYCTEQQSNNDGGNILGAAPSGRRSFDDPQVSRFV